MAAATTTETVKIRTLTDTEHQDVLSALETLHSIVGSAAFSAKSKALPAFPECTTESHGFVLSRTLEAIKAKEEEISRNLVAGAKEKIDTLAHETRTKRIKAWRGVVAACEANPDMKELVGDKCKTPTATYIPLASVREFFPASMKDTDLPGAVVKMGYKLTERTKGSKDELTRSIEVSINAAHIDPQVVAAPTAAPVSGLDADLAVALASAASL